MAVKNLSTTLIYKALDTVNRIGKTGDGANHTLRLVQDGTPAEPNNSPVEIDATDCPGDYSLALDQAERNYNITCLSGKSSTANIVLTPVQVFSEGLKGTSVVLCYFAFDTINNEGKTGDVANHTLRLIKDGTEATPTNAPAEVDSTNCPGLYKLTVTAAESDFVSLMLTGESSTANIEIIPVQVYPYTIPATPTISAVVDGGDQDSIDVTVTGTGTIQLYYRIAGTTSWTTGQTRSGSGDITQTGLTAGQVYEIYITDNVGGIVSAPSAISTIYVLGTSTLFEESIVAKLAADATITGIVGTQIYVNRIPERAADGTKPTVPALTYQVLFADRDHQLSGPTGLVEGRLQINCIDEDYSVVKQLSEAVRKEFDGFYGTVSGVRIYDCFLDNEIDDPAYVAGQSELTRYKKILDFRISFDDAD
jgi:hypothetical protein